VLVGSGDIAICGSQGSELTARLLDRISGVVALAPLLVADLEDIPTGGVARAVLMELTA
jgi:hypothetical protein